MVGINPFKGKSNALSADEESQVVERINSDPYLRPNTIQSHWDRLDPKYRQLCERLGKLWNRSPKNKKVRAAVDRMMVD